MNPKKIAKSIGSLEKQKDKHLEKINDYDGKNEFLIDYWKKEIKQFEDKIKELKEKLGKKNGS